MSRTRTTTGVEPFTGTARVIRERGSTSTSRPLLDRLMSLGRSRQEEGDVSLDEIIQPGQDYDRFACSRGIDLLSARTLYRAGRLAYHTGFFKHHRETRIRCFTGDAVTRTLFSTEAAEKLYTDQKQYQYMHMGLIVIGISGLMRQDTGCKTLVTIYDERWKDMGKALIGLTEVDMNRSRGIFYCSPNYMLTIDDFVRFIKIGIQTKGYESADEGDNNLFTIGFLGRCTTRSRADFKVKIDETVKLISTQGLEMCPPEAYSPTIHAGQEWEMSKFIKKAQVLQPTSTVMNTDRSGNMSVRFNGYSLQILTCDPVEQKEDEHPPNRELVYIKTEPGTISRIVKDKILYPVEMGMTDLTPEELTELEDQCRSTGQLVAGQFLHYDLEKNIRILEVSTEEPEILIYGEDSDDEDSISQSDDFHEISLTYDLETITRSLDLVAVQSSTNLIEDLDYGPEPEPDPPDPEPDPELQSVISEVDTLSIASHISYKKEFMERGGAQTQSTPMEEEVTSRPNPNHRPRGETTSTSNLPRRPSQKYSRRMDQIRNHDQNELVHYHDSDSDNELINDFGTETRTLAGWTSDAVLSNLVHITLVHPSECIHEWKTSEGSDSTPCFYCKWYPSLLKRAKCPKCYTEGCISCINSTYNLSLSTSFAKPTQDIGNLELNILSRKVANLEDHNQMLYSKIAHLEDRISCLDKGKQPLINPDPSGIGGLSLCNLAQYTPQTTEYIYNQDVSLKTIKVSCEIRLRHPKTKELFIINTQALINSGCTNCIINQDLIPSEYWRKSPYSQDAQQMDVKLYTYTHTVLPGSTICFLTNCGDFSQQYNLPYEVTWIRPLQLGSVDFILGLNFLLADGGSVLLSRDYIHIHKQTLFTPVEVTARKRLTRTSEYVRKRGGPIDNNKTIDDIGKKLAKFDQELNKLEDEEDCQCSVKGSGKKKPNFTHEVSEDKYDPTSDPTSDLYEEEITSAEVDLDEVFSRSNDLADMKKISHTLFTAPLDDFDLEDYIDRLEKLQIIGEDITKHWEKDKVICKLEILNPDYKIKTKKIESNNEDREDFKMHIKKLLRFNAIKKSISPHRSAAFIVRKHSEIARGKSKMVINYKRLNDNTVDDAYDLPDQTQLVNNIQNSQIYSKFDCKSGFWQVRMHPDSIPWTAFTCPEGHFEWSVMPFGLKNAPSVFQRKMDDVFKTHINFVAVYVDDILVFSKTKREHKEHLNIVFEEFIKHGIIISKKKMELEKAQIEFLGSVFGNGITQLKPHISTKILDFPDKLEDLKQLQSFLGLLNYASPYIKDLGKIAGPLYSKTSLKGQRYFNQEDVKLVQQIIIRNYMILILLISVIFLCRWKDFLVSLA
ncbi:uncharacterized protein LOC132274189 [Cornus florida]|uniref:uncharacterized protein LOC132274189 n=1 Tax=Cornus florida TaxID=4283 RepID=UPI00289B3D7D|nr:uncharacterized protein LOC132274189 [Cornus florida]XP_059631380.1 uncharacterized protein LOC132274189 [Cornus florida]XP_059631381.1 uncharacterized protein LOC132274189 [Cornus florida]XP_059631382.1 uncharacterized protein LOC132274189 [Cornus florida]XP_059631383.1 uncharacterized protein LOC132274189 [Cornus florida]